MAKFSGDIDLSDGDAGRLLAGLVSRAGPAGITESEIRRQFDLARVELLDMIIGAAVLGLWRAERLDISVSGDEVKYHLKP